MYSFDDSFTIKPATVQPAAKPASATAEHMATPNSSWIASMTYDSADLRLTVTLKNGFEVQHLMVYPNQWTELKLAPSKGSHYAKNIQKQHVGVLIKPVMKASEFPKRRGR